MKIFHKSLFSTTIFTFFFITSCATMNMSLTQKYKLSVESFTNETVYYNLNSNLTALLNEEFLRDSNIALTKTELADIRLTGAITRYEKSTLSYDTNNAAESYELLIFVKIRLINNSDEEIIFEKENIVGDTVYRTTEGGNTAYTNNVLIEETAQQEILEFLSQDISRMIIMALAKQEQETIAKFNTPSLATSAQVNTETTTQTIEANSVKITNTTITEPKQ